MSDWLNFTKDLDAILGGIQDAADEALEAGVRAGCDTAKKEWKAGAPVDKGDYKKSIRFRVSGKGGKVEGIVYSKMPGLPHLLEKGHAKVGGGKTRAIKHIEPAADDGFEDAYRVVNETIGGLL